MKKTTFSTIALCAIVTLSACNLDKPRKPLMGGIQQVEATQADEGKTEVELTTTSEGLEIPSLTVGTKGQILKRTGYTLSYNKDTRLPNWVAWRLTAEHCDGDVKRPRKAFHEDEDVPKQRATDEDYYGSGYDRGHMCPAADNKWSEDVMYESFLFTNMCPQDHGLNIGDWNEMEQTCRKWAQKFGSVYIVCGPILYKGKHKTIGKHKVVVPEAFFKVVLCMEGTPKTIGFIYKNTDGNRPKGDYVNTVDQVERITGYDFFPSLPDDIEKRIEAVCDINEW